MTAVNFSQQNKQKKRFAKCWELTGTVLNAATVLCVFAQQLNGSSCSTVNNNSPAECYVCSVVHLTFTVTYLYLMLQCEDTLCHEYLYHVQQLNASSYSKVKLQLSSECYFCRVVHVIFTVFPLYPTLQWTVTKHPVSHTSTKYNFPVPHTPMNYS